MGFFKNIAKSISLKNIVKVATGQAGDVVKEVAGRIAKEVTGGKSTTSTSSAAAAATAAVQAALTGAPIAATASRAAAALYTKPAVGKTPAVSVKPAIAGKAAIGILGTKISTGNATIDKVLSGAATGAVKAVSNEKPVKDLSETLGDIVAKNWFERNWYFVAGGALALVTLLKRRGKR